MFAILLLAMTPLDVVEIPSEEPTSEAYPAADPGKAARAMERIANSPVPKPPKPKVSAEPVFPLPKINADSWPLPPVPPQRHGGLPVEQSSRRIANPGGSGPPPPELTWYERLQPEGWQVALAFKIVVLALLIRWLQRMHWLTVAARFARAHWAQIIGLPLLGFIDLKMGGVDFPSWRYVLGLPELSVN